MDANPGGARVSPFGIVSPECKVPHSPLEKYLSYAPLRSLKQGITTDIFILARIRCQSYQSPSGLLRNDRTGVHLLEQTFHIALAVEIPDNARAAQ
jgi:hypothetical protein